MEEWAELETIGSPLALDTKELVQLMATAQHTDYREASSPIGHNTSRSTRREHAYWPASCYKSCREGARKDPGSWRRKILYDRVVRLPLLDQLRATDAWQNESQRNGAKTYPQFSASRFLCLLRHESQPRPPSSTSLVAHWDWTAVEAQMHQSQSFKTTQPVDRECSGGEAPICARWSCRLAL